MLRTIRRTAPALVVACLMLAGSERASAQVVVAEYCPAPPVVAYYAPAPVVYPASASYYVPGVSYYAVPTLSYYAPPVVGYSAAPYAASTTRYGLFGAPRVTRNYYYPRVYLP